MSHYFENDDNLVSNIQDYELFFENVNFSFSTDNGVFSKGKIDFGTNLLIRNALKKSMSGDILDLGCGYGVIGIVLKKLRDINVTMIDVNKRAVHLTKMNAKKNNVLVNALVSDGFENINSQFDFIISNPPIRVGKQKLYELVLDMKNYLKKDGEIFLVIRKEQGALSFIRDMNVYYSVKTIDKDKGFLIISLKNN